METSEIIKALRCAATPIEESPECRECPYFVKIPLTQIDIELGLPEDFNYYCDSDKIMLDAAERLDEQ